MRIWCGTSGTARHPFGRKWRRARDKVGLPEDFRFYDLRHTGNTLAADTGAKLKDLMVRAGQSSERAQLIYQHSTKEHQRRLAADIDLDVRRQQSYAASERGGATVHPLVPRPPGPSAPRAARR
ncbi:MULTISPECIES: hypothetical protein [unclassified Streptomyces]|uniref:hypothetical protein n=1 Tax=unclassified Streptomyces TaxID=2593676 RepID=UPI0037F307B9